MQASARMGAAAICGLTLLAGNASAANWFEIQGTQGRFQQQAAELWGFLQPTYFYSTNDVAPDGSSRKNDFVVRRARLGVRGVIPKTNGILDYFVLTEWGRNGITLDPNGLVSNRGALTDASITLNLIPGARLRFGQFKLPVGVEGLQAIQVFDYIDFTGVYLDLVLERFGTNRSVSAFRDIGVQAFDWWRFGPAKEWELAYAVFVNNGNGINVQDNDANKDVIGKVTFSRIFDDTSGPHRKDAEVGAWYQTGKRTGYSFGPGGANGAAVERTRTRFGLELVFQKVLGPAGWLRLSGESIWGNGWVYAPTYFGDAVPAGSRYYTENTSVDGHGVPHADLDAWGWYAEAGYRPPFPGRSLEVDARYSYYDPDRDDALGTDVSQHAVTLGLQWYFNEGSRLTFNAALRESAWDDSVGNAYMVQLTAIFPP